MDRRNLTLWIVIAFGFVTTTFIRPHTAYVTSPTSPKFTVPTRTPVPTEKKSTYLPLLTRNTSRSQLQAPSPTPATLFTQRFGFTIGGSTEGCTFSHGDFTDVAQLNAGWYISYFANTTPYQPHNLQHIQLISVGAHLFDPETFTQTVGPKVDANPGDVWLIGNEPDRANLQDDRTPEQYAELYHLVYTFIKQRDPSSLIAIGGIVQPTPLRLAYLDRVIAHYQNTYGTMIPVDIWNIHNMLLNEERGGWGAGIPPGFDDVDEGFLLPIDQHANLQIFKQQLIDFRLWMKQHGEQEKPLWVTEYGVLIPPDIGYPEEDVITFLRGSFDIFLTTTDEKIGYPADAHRLVQRWAWYSLNGPIGSPEQSGFNGSLYDHDTCEMTDTGRAYAQYTSTPDLTIGNVITTTPGMLHIQIINEGVMASNAGQIALTQNNGDIISLWPLESIPAGIEHGRWLTHTLITPNLNTIELLLIVDPANTIPESDEQNNSRNVRLPALPPPSLTVYMPLIIQSPPHNSQAHPTHSRHPNR